MAVRNMYRGVATSQLYQMVESTHGHFRPNVLSHGHKGDADDGDWGGGASEISHITGRRHDSAPT